VEYVVATDRKVMLNAAETFAVWKSPRLADSKVRSAPLTGLQQLVDSGDGLK
jgi:hypothetical protein